MVSAKKFKELCLVVSAVVFLFFWIGCGGEEGERDSSIEERDADGDIERDGDNEEDADVDDDADAVEREDADIDDDVNEGADADGDEDIDQSSFDCFEDGDCTGDQGCYHGRCRHHCTFGSCLFAPGGGVCRDDYCVECVGETQCEGSRLVCDMDTFDCVIDDSPFDPTITKFGIFYSLWHCTVATGNPTGFEVHDISEILAGREDWGAYHEFHWWDEPAAGYYCLSRNDALLAQHATMLRDAGIDFVFLDVTNHPYVSRGGSRAVEMILEPFERLLAVWSGIAGAPQIVPWVPVVEAGTDASQFTVDALLQRLSAFPEMHFHYLGRPLLLVTENDPFPVNEERFGELEETYTVRRMWGLLERTGPRWSFLERCRNSPTEPDLCRQRMSSAGGEVEQIPIATAYQDSFMSITSTATPKHQGLTFRRQFETLRLEPEVPIVTITGWNEWIAQRQPCDESPEGCFIDLWDIEFNRDIEPGINVMGDYYYRLMTECIALFRAGEFCDPSNSDNLCCRDYEP